MNGLNYVLNLLEAHHSAERGIKSEGDTELRYEVAKLALDTAYISEPVFGEDDLMKRVLFEAISKGIL